MKKFTVLLMILGLALIAVPAMADTYVSTLNTVSTHDSGFSTDLGNYGTVVVNLNTAGTIATVSMTPRGEGPPDFDFHFFANTAWLNVNAPTSAFNESNFSGTWGATEGSFSPDSLGAFNLQLFNIIGSVEAVSLTLTRTSGSWTSASDVLAFNLAGFDAGAFLIEDSASGNPGGYVGEKVPLPPSALLLGSGLLGLVGLRFRRKNAA